MPADTVTFTVDLAEDFDPSIEVGTVYEVGINGVGYMLADDPEQPEQKYRRSVTPLEPQRLATGDTPYSEAVQRIQFASMVDWSSGMGQTFYDRENAARNAYRDSISIDPFTVPGKIRVLETMVLEEADTYASLTLVVSNNVLYYVSAAGEMSAIANPGDAPTTFAPADAVGAVTPSDLTTDGTYWYGATGGSVIRNNSAASPAASWSTYNAMSLRWAAGRIVVAGQGAGASSPNQFTSLAPDGTEERVGGHLTLDDGWEIILGGEAAGHYYFAAFRGTVGQVYAWKLGLDANGDQFFPFVAWDLPDGLKPVQIGTGGGSVFVKSYGPPVAADENFQVSLYRGIPGSDGSLTVFLIDELAGCTGTGHDFTSKMTQHGDLILFSWPDVYTGRTGFGAISLTTGGYCRWLAAPAAAGVAAISSMDMWRGRPVIHLVGVGIYIEAIDVFEATASLTMSVVDGKTSLLKVLDKITLQFDPLVATQVITPAYSIDEGLSYISTTTVETDGAIRAELTINESAFSFSLKLTFTTGAAALSIKMEELQYHVIGLADAYLQLPVNCADNITLLNGRPAPENGAGKGMARARTLQALTQTRVLLQDIDYHLTGLSETWELVSTDIMSTHLYDRKRGGTLANQVAVLTLRKVGP